MNIHLFRCAAIAIISLTLLSSRVHSEESFLITTVAGGGVGDGREATLSYINKPEGQIVDESGNLYFADSNNHRIRKIDPSGTITTVAGSGIQGFNGDGQKATVASLNTPSDVAIDDWGNLFVLDKGNNRIRKVNPDGIISTVAGNGDVGFSGEGDGKPAIEVPLPPTAITVDHTGNLFIATSHLQVRKVNRNGIITTYAGNGTEGFSGDDGPAIGASLRYPAGLAIDNYDNLYIADTGNLRIRKVDHSTSIITTVAGNGLVGVSGDAGPAKDASLNVPSGLGIDRRGNLFIAESSRDCISCIPHINRIRKVDDSGIITTVAGSNTGGYSGDYGDATLAELNNPHDISIDHDDNIFISDMGNNRIRKVSRSGIITSFSGGCSSEYCGDGGLASESRLNLPTGVVHDQHGSLFISDTGNNRIRKVNSNGIIVTIAGDGTAGFSGDNGPAQSASLNNPQGIAIDNIGNLYIADTYNSRVRKIDSFGFITTVAGGGTGNAGNDGDPATEAILSFPRAVATDRNGNLFVTEYRVECWLASCIITNSRIRKIDALGNITTLANIPLYGPSDLSVDNEGNLFVANTYSAEVLKIDVFGFISRVAGNGTRGFSGDNGQATSASLTSPRGIFPDQYGNLFISDYWASCMTPCPTPDDLNHRIRKVDSRGIITTITGKGLPGFSGDGGPAILAMIDEPWGLTSDGLGTLYFADQRNNRVRKLYKNKTPIPQNDYFSIGHIKSETVAVPIPGVLANDNDPDGDPIAILGATESIPRTISLTPNGGSVRLFSDGHFEYKPDSTDFNGERRFRYKISDGHTVSHWATVTLAIRRSPRAINDTATTIPGQQVTVHALSNDKAFTPATIAQNSIRIYAPPSNGAASIDESGDIVYTPNNKFRGTDILKYTILDSFDNISNPATVTILIPSAENDIFTTLASVKSHQTVTIPAAKGVKANDLPEKPGGSFNLIAEPVRTAGLGAGTLRINSFNSTNGSFRYTLHGVGATGTDKQDSKRGTWEFKYTMTLNGVRTEPAIVKLIIQ